MEPVTDLHKTMNNLKESMTTIERYGTLKPGNIHFIKVIKDNEKSNLQLYRDKHFVLIKNKYQQHFMTGHSTVDDQAVISNSEVDCR